ncbi:MAG: MucB/RseB C-terminal domain-containing protein [Betaproteobacteria bacterium]
MNHPGSFSQPLRMKALMAGISASLCFASTSAWSQSSGMPLPSPMPPSSALQKSDAAALEWVDKISRSARELPYSGVFVHQTAEGATTTRIAHMVDKQGVEHEKLELMDGPLTEIIRRNEELTCYRPETKTISVDRRATGRFFPSLIAGNSRSIAENYRVKMGNIERIAGYECQWIILEPRDAMRYMQKLCADVGTGLLLRAKLFNDRRQVVEQFMFTQLDASRGLAKQALKSRYEQAQGWQKIYAVNSVKDTETGWLAGNLPAGFRKIMEMTRNLIGRPTPVSHLVYSDGVLSVSVFVESAQNDPNSVTSVLAEDGPTSFAMRSVADHQVTVMGEVPLAAVQTIADGVSRRARY